MFVETINRPLWNFTNYKEISIPFQSFFFGFLGLRERDFALHRGQIGALRWICWWQDMHDFIGGGCWRKAGEGPADPGGGARFLASPLLLFPIISGACGGGGGRKPLPPLWWFPDPTPAAVIVKLAKAEGVESSLSGNHSSLGFSKNLMEKLLGKYL